MTKILVIPDTQVKPGHDLSYLERIGRFIVDKQPDVVVHLGDHADMPSLSSYDVGKKSFEGRRYINDIAAAKDGNRLLWSPLDVYNERQRKNGKRQYNPERHILIGNHEDRIDRAINSDPKLDGVLSIKDLDYDKHWTVHPFLSVVIIEGVAFSHYFVTGVAGRPAGTAAAQLRKTNMSSIAGHQQGRQVAYATRADGKTITSIIAGSCYEHDEDYMGAQGNKHWRGLIMLHEVNDGAFDESFISLNFLNKKYA
jgi:hypothetical protein